MSNISEYMNQPSLGPCVKEFGEHLVAIIQMWMEGSKKGRYLGKLDDAELNFYNFIAGR